MVLLQVIGCLGRDAETRTTSNGQELSTFSIASSNADGTTTWFSVVTPKNPRVHEYLKKGAHVWLQGDLKTSIYKDQVDLSVYANRVFLCGQAPAKEETPLPQVPPMPDPFAGGYPG